MGMVFLMPFNSTAEKEIAVSTPDLIGALIAFLMSPFDNRVAFLSK
jgi:hypothetical protein